MKNFLIIFSAILIIACESSDVKISEPSATESQEIKDIGDSLSQKLLVALKNELTTAIQEKGVVNAIQVCNIKALPITQEVANSKNIAIDIKRTTNKFRNPKNKPDTIEKVALNFYENLLQENKPIPEFYIQKISENEKHSFNYYKPLKTAGLCLLCHGDPNTMDASLKDVLNRLYPNDLATGYKDGDFRALLRIKVMEKN
jgi:hypothetical protein